MKQRNWMHGVMIVLAIAVAGGCGSLDDDPCRDWCDAQALCAEKYDQMFSDSRCLRECRDAREEHEFVGCGLEYDAMLACIQELKCSDYDEKVAFCGYEMGQVDDCIGDE